MQRNFRFLISKLVFALVLISACSLPLNAEKKHARERAPTTQEQLRNRLTKLEALVKEQQKLIHQLLENKKNGHITALLKRIQELEDQVRKLSALTDSKKLLPQETATEKRPENAAGEETSSPTLGAEKQLPDISVIINGSTHLTGDSTNVDRNRFLVNEGEIGMQGYLYPGIRGDAFFSFSRDAGKNELTGSVEEAYGTFLETPIKNLAVKFGKTRIDFGKTNKIHQHHLPYEDRPAALKNFLGPDSLNGSGIEADYLLPTPKGTFAQLQLGWWRPESSPLNPLTGLEPDTAGSRIADQLFTGRLWTSKELGEDSELEIGLNSAFGRSLINGSGDNRVDPIRIYGADVTFRKFLSPHERLALSAEWFLHHRLMSIGTAARSGYYLLGTYQPNNYWELGLRYDNSGLPAPSLGREWALTGFLTNRLTETTYIRYQLKNGQHFTGPSYTEFILQFVWGIGPHSHPLQ